MPFIHPERRLHQGGGLDQFDDELPALAEAGVGGVVSLLNIPGDAGLYEQAGFKFVCLPVLDGQPPSVDQVRELVQFVEQCRSNGAVAVHCEAGCGRTGTMISAYLIAKGDRPDDAIKRVRAAEPSAVETRAQIEFLASLPGLLTSGSKAPI